MIIGELLTCTEHVVCNTDGCGFAAGFLVHDGQVDLLQLCRKVLRARCPRLFQVPPTRHTTLVTNGHQTRHKSEGRGFYFQAIRRWICDFNLVNGERVRIIRVNYSVKGVVITVELHTVKKKSVSHVFTMFLVGRQTGWISLVKLTGFFMCSRAMSLFRFSFQLYLGWMMISSIATIFSTPLSYLISQRQQ